MSANLSAAPKLQFFDNNGNPLVGGKLYTYAAGTTTPLATYTDASAVTPNTNPIILDSRGEANVWLLATTYKFLLTDSTDATIWTVDNISNSLSLSQILAASGSAASPPYTFASDTSTGMYLQAIGQLGLSVAGTPVLRATDTQMTIGQSGGADDVDITHFGDTTQTGNFTLTGDVNVTGAAVFNEAGADKDFRVEGDTDPNLLFVDASTDRVGVGTSSPGARLEVRENTSCSSIVSTALNSFTVYVLDPAGGSPPSPGATTLTSTSASLNIDALQLNALCVYNTDVSSGFGQRDVYAAPVSGALGYLSSLRGRKTNIESIADVSWLYELNPVSFYYKKQVDGVSTDEPEGLKQLGLIAEEVEQVRPELCFYDFVEGEEPALRGVSYSSLITPLLKAVQQLKEELNSAKARIAALESQ